MNEEKLRIADQADELKKEAQVNLGDRILAVKRGRLSSPEPERCTAALDDAAREEADSTGPDQIVSIPLTDQPPNGEILDDQGNREHHGCDQIEVNESKMSQNIMMFDILWLV